MRLSNSNSNSTCARYTEAENAALLRIVSKKVREKEEVVWRVFARKRSAVTSSR